MDSTPRDDCMDAGGRATQEQLPRHGFAHGWAYVAEARMAGSDCRSGESRLDAMDAGAENQGLMPWTTKRLMKPAAGLQPASPIQTETRPFAYDLAVRGTYAVSRPKATTSY